MNTSRAEAALNLLEHFIGGDGINRTRTNFLNALLSHFSPFTVNAAVGRV
jgi:hypothetical protein